MVVLFLSTAAAAEDVNELARAAGLITDTFMQESFRLRMGYEYNGEFLIPDDKNNLYKLAKKAGEELQTIAEKQNRLKQQIEDYNGDDWDIRYGSTGLWRKLSAQLYVTNLDKCEIDYYLALAADQPQQSRLLQDILNLINSLDQLQTLSYTNLLMAKVLALLARTDPSYKAAAIKQLDTLKLQSEVVLATSAAIEKIKLTGPQDTDQLDTLVRTLAQNYHKEYLELILSAAFLQKRRYTPQAFEKTVNLFPQIEDIAGSFVLSALSSRQEQLQQLSVFEAELAVQAARENTTQDHKWLLDYLCEREKFQTPLILYTAAEMTAESSPVKAAELLVKASSLQMSQKSSRLEISAGQIAAQAAQMAYGLLAEDANNCALALEAFDNYFTIADNQFDEELEYLYTIVLNICGRCEKGKELLKKIASSASGIWRNRAKRDLTVQTIRQGRYENQADLAETVCCLLEVGDPELCENIDDAMALLSGIVDRIDGFEVHNPQFMADCKKLAQVCYDCLDGRQKRTAGLFLAEVSLFEAAGDQEKLSNLERLLDNLASNSKGDDVDLLRCRARLLTEQNRFDKAAKLWAQICRMQKNDTGPANRPSRQWWRAKFYELDCWAKCPQTKKEDVLHTIEVLESTLSDIPPLWADKLNLLKQRSSSQSIGTGK